MERRAASTGEALCIGGGAGGGTDVGGVAYTQGDDDK